MCVLKHIHCGIIISNVNQKRSRYICQACNFIVKHIMIMIMLAIGWSMQAYKAKHFKWISLP